MKNSEKHLIYSNQVQVFSYQVAGVGKSYLIQKMKNWADKNERNMQVTAMTGAASLLIGGKTLHSWGGIGLGDANPEILVQKSRKVFQQR